MEPEVLFDVADGIGTITLNRPRTLNALTMNMIAEMRASFTAWMADDAVKAVVIKGAGDRAFCAGGDVRAVRQSIIEYDGDANPGLAQEFFYEEYILNHQIHVSPKPYIALIDRVCMGGGVGLSVHGSFRVATERTRVGMPETTIGLFPDVGGAWFLSRLPGESGTYLALTGIPVTVGDCERLGISTHVVASETLEEIEAKLHASDLSGDAHAVVKAVLDSYVIEAGDAPTADAQAEVDHCFSPDTVEEIVARLKASGSDFANHALETLGSKSPISLKVTLEQIRRGGRATTFAETMTMEYRMSQHFARGNDFPEGVRALLVDKDHKPNWNPARLEDVSDAAVAGYFEPVPWRELTFD
jgi:enoyl-CoA hydratase